MKNLIQIVNEIIELNPKCLLSGSLAINMQGFKTRREPTDIDLWIQSSEVWKKLPEMKICSANSQYSENSHDRVSYTMGEVKIDVFSPIKGIEFEPLRTKIDGINMLTVDEILKFKIEHAFDKEYEDESLKHVQDVIYILQSLLPPDRPSPNP